MVALESFWSLAPFGGLLVAAVAIAYAMLRLRRSRRTNAAQQPLQAPASDNGADDTLDSSHIGFAPLVGAIEPPPYDHGVAGGDAQQK